MSNRLGNDNRRRARHRARSGAVVIALAVAATVAACGSDANDAADGDDASVGIAAPEDGATVSSPIALELTADNFVIEPAGEVRDGAGHLHAMIDVPGVDPGEVIPSDESHVHYGDGATTDELDLEPGEHTICVQAGDGVHTALDLTDTVTFTVADPG